MALESGWVIIPRDILNFEWSDDYGSMTLYIRMILLANISDSEWHGVTVKRGSFVSSYESLSKQTKLSVKQLRTAVTRLETAGKISRTVYSKFTVYTVIGYDEMQNPKNERASKIAPKGQTKGSQEANKGQAKGKQILNEQTDLSLSDEQQRASKGQAKGSQEADKGQAKGNRINNKINKYISPPIVPPLGDGQGSENGFALFWKSYPRKTAKQDAQKAWDKLKPNDELVREILAALEKQKNSSQWRRGYIPNPATWLNGKRWEDEMETEQTEQNDTDYGNTLFGWGD